VDSGSQHLQGACRFAGFELDLRAGELRKDEAKQVRLREQPFLILTKLLEHAGEVVTREEIRKKLWPNDTIVEFEHSISAAMNRLRQALGDSADNSSLHRDSGPSRLPANRTGGMGGGCQPARRSRAGALDCAWAGCPGQADPTTAE